MKRILVIGGGSIGERHVRCFQRTARATVSLCESNDEVRNRVGGEYGLPAVYSSLDEAIAVDFDAAVICTPAHLHVPMARQLAERNFALLIEKPLSTTTDGVDELVAIIEEKQLPVSIAYVMRHHPALQAVKRELDSGRLGRAVQIVAVSGQHFPFYRPAYREIYYAARETGGGAIQDALTHQMNAIQWLVGPITRLVADAEHAVLDGVDVEDTAHIITRHDAGHDNSVLGSFSLNQYQPTNELTITVHCERGSFRVEFHLNRWLSCDQPDSDWTVEEHFSLERDDLFVRQAQAFLDQIDGAADAVCPLRDGLQTLRANLAALRSLEEQRWIEL